MFSFPDSVLTPGSVDSSSYSSVLRVKLECTNANNLKIKLSPQNHEFRLGKSVLLSCGH